MDFSVNGSKVTGADDTVARLDETVNGFSWILIDRINEVILITVTFVW